MSSTDQFQRRTGITDVQVLDDIRENTIHILGRCNNPADWGDSNHQGLVYGMVQSGKTASMINLNFNGNYCRIQIVHYSCRR